MRPLVIPGIVLAAGASTRLGGGRAKQLLTVGGITLLRRAAGVAVAAAGEGTPVVVVLGHRAEECAFELSGLPVRAVRAEGWAAGMGASLKAGLRAVVADAPEAPGVVVSLCDQPRVTAADLRMLRPTAADGAEAVVAAGYPDAPGVPAYFGREVFKDLLDLDDAAGAKGLLLRLERAGRLRRVSMPGAAVDVDTPGDADRLTG